MGIEKENLKILFMGTPEFALVHLKSLVEAKFRIVGVVSQPDKPSGRGLKLKQTPTKEYANLMGIPVFQPEKLKAGKEEVEKMLNKLKPDVIIVVAYGKILPKYILDFPKYGCINVHGSILPKYRGAAPIQWSVINGDSKTGVTMMYMDEGMDTGDIIEMSECEIKPDDTYGSVHDKMAKLGGARLVQLMERLCKEGGKLSSFAQPNNFTIAPMLSRENSHIDFNSTPETVINLVRGTNPAPVAWCEKDGTPLKVYKANIVEDDIKYEDKELGEVVYLNDRKNILQVKVKTGFVSLEEIKPAGSKKMSAGDYIRGNKIKVGDILR